MSSAKKTSNAADDTAKKKTAKAAAKPAESKTPAKASSKADKKSAPAKPAAKHHETPDEPAAEKTAAAKSPSVSGRASAKGKSSAAPAEQGSASRRMKAAAPAPAPAAAEAEPVRKVSVQLGPSRPLLAGAPGAMPVGRAIGKAAVPAKPEPPRAVSERRLSKKELSEIRESLLARMDEIIESMRRDLAGQRERAGAKAADDLDKASDASDENISFEIASAKDEELREIQAALDKLDKGTYGQCESCGLAISPSRLKVLPSATTCVSCRGEEERMRHREDSGSIFSILGDEDHVEADPET